MMRNARKCLMQFSDSASPDQPLHFPLIESMNTVVYVDEQRMLISDSPVVIL